MLFDFLVLATIFVVSCTVDNVSGFDLLSTSDVSRRTIFQQAKTSMVGVVGITIASTGLLVPTPAVAASTIESCPPRSQNCIRTTWTLPSGTKDVTNTVLDLFKSYPQEGQSDVDKGGWTIVSADDSTIRIEYKSGIGNFAKYFNGGKPFIDDVIVSVSDGVVNIRSSSRVGESDFNALEA